MTAPLLSYDSFTHIVARPSPTEPIVTYVTGCDPAAAAREHVDKLVGARR